MLSLFEHLDKGSKVDEFLEWFPDVTAEQVHQVLAFAKAGRDARDKALYRRRADRLNAEAGDVLDFQSLREGPHYGGESFYTMTTDLAGSLAGKRLPATNARSKFRRP